MARWEPNAPQRLAVAALNLFAEHGYDAVTVDEIARAAGVTRRTFFRHFPDKREVLFDQGPGVQERFAAGLAAAPADAPPLDVVAAGLAEVSAVLQDRRAFARRRQAVIATTPELEERELAKLASWSAAGAAALRDRGVAEPTATLASETAMAAFRVAFARWATADDAPPLGDVVAETLAALRTLAA